MRKPPRPGGASVSFREEAGMNRKLLALSLTSIMMFGAGTCVANADYYPKDPNLRSRSLSAAYVREVYPWCRKVKRVRYGKSGMKVIRSRAGKPYVVIASFTSYSKGNGGYSKKHEYTAYNKYVKPGKRVVSYYVMNPKNNLEDDIVAVIDNGMIRE